jgi:hypothetical protein
MIHCIPRGICSWNYLISGDGHRGTLEFHWLGEQGAMNVDGAEFAIVKQGTFSGAWTLNYQGSEVVWARKSSLFTRGFAVDDPSGSFSLQAESALGRSFLLKRGDVLVAIFRPEHPFTRRANIEVLAESWDAPTILFCFWLVALMWRRQNNSG